MTFFDNFAARLNNVFEQFCINYSLTRNGFMPYQDKKNNRGNIPASF